MSETARYTLNDLLPGARVAVGQCLNVTPDDRVYIMTDRDTLLIGEALAEAARERGAAAVRTVLLEDFGQRPFTDIPEGFIEAIVDFAPTVTFYAAQAQPGEIAFRIKMGSELRQRLNVRHGHMIGITPPLMMSGMLANYEDVAALTLRVYERVKNAREIRVTNADGTDFTATLDPNRLRWNPRFALPTSCSAASTARRSRSASSRRRPPAASRARRMAGRSASARSTSATSRQWEASGRQRRVASSYLPQKMQSGAFARPRAAGSVPSVVSRDVISVLPPRNDARRAAVGKGSRWVDQNLSLSWQPTADSGGASRQLRAHNSGECVLCKLTAAYGVEVGLGVVGGLALPRGSRCPLDRLRELFPGTPPGSRLRCGSPLPNHQEPPKWPGRDRLERSA